MTDNNMVVLDLEMTGLNPKSDKIIEIGAVRIKDSEIFEKYEKLISPGRLLSQKTTQVTGITDDLLLDKPDFSEIKMELLEFLKDDVLVGHNILQDYSFLKRAILNNMPKGYKFERAGIDTLKIARKSLPGEQKKSLSALCEYFQIEHKPHRALDDALATYELYKKLYAQFGNENPEWFCPNPLIYQVKRDVPIMPKQIKQIENLLNMYNLEPIYDLKRLTKNEASRYYDQIKSGLFNSSTQESHQEK